MIVCTSKIIVLPCPEYPPEKSLGGWFWYNMENSRYKCPNGFMFANGNYPYWYSNCTMAKIWDPPAVEECIRKSTTTENNGSVHVLHLVSSSVLVIHGLAFSIHR